jgi:hypothetical protein
MTDPNEQAIERVREWTRVRFRLQDAASIAVTEIACDVPGCPPKVTIVTFRGGDGEECRFRAFKPAAEMLLDDLPPIWLRGALTMRMHLGCMCC